MIVLLQILIVLYMDIIIWIFYCLVEKFLHIEIDLIEEYLNMIQILGKDYLIRRIVEYSFD